MVKIRWVQLGDTAAEVQAVIDAAFLSTHGHMFSDEEKVLFLAGTAGDYLQFTWTLPPQGPIALAVDAGRIVGATVMHRHNSRGKYTVIEPMSVLPEYQGHNVGTRLWRFVATESKRFGDRGLQVWPLDRNEAGINFFQKHLRLQFIGKGEWRLRDHVEAATGLQEDFYSS
jgi:GNAT superfamily N-acetyltransferase